jgi:hypothetical protein
LKKGKRERYDEVKKRLKPQTICFACFANRYPKEKLLKFSYGLYATKSFS